MSFVLLRHFIQIQSHPIFALYSLMLSEEVANAIFIVFGFTWLGLDPTIYRTRGKHVNHYDPDTVFFTFMQIVIIVHIYLINIVTILAQELEIVSILLNMHAYFSEREKIV
jgi:hypothetical protein